MYDAVLQIAILLFFDVFPEKDLLRIVSLSFTRNKRENGVMPGVPLDFAAFCCIL